MRIRDASEQDIAQIAAIYGHHVLTGLASFEEAAPGEEEMLARYRAVRAGGFPYLVAVVDGEIAGYSYATLYRTRPAYRHTVEDSVYVRPGFERRGIGAQLLAALLERCRAGPWKQMVAVIGDSANAPSIELHRRLGFRTVGTLEAVGFKFGRWVDSVLMQRAI
jgi:phosphinothricin acetyltransferase